MEITTSPGGKTEMVGKATFSPEEVSQGFEQVYTQKVSKVKIPGFRPGKAPYNVFVTYYGLDSIKEDYIDIAYAQAFEKLIGEKKIRMVGRPNLKVISFPDNGPLELEITIEHVPDFELPDLSKITINVPKFEVTETDINSAIDRICLQYATMEPVDRKAQESDFVYFKWAAINDGRASDRWKEELVEVGRDDFVKGFDRNLLGKSKDDTGKATVELSEGKEPVEIEYVIGQIKERKMPALTDELAKTVGFDTVDTLKKAVEAELSSANEERRQQHIEQELFKTFLDKIKIDIPKRLMDASVEDEWNSLARELARRNITMTQYLTSREITEEQLRAELTPKAENNTKLDIILDEFAEKLEIDVKKEEIDSEIEKIRAYMKQTGRQTGNLTSDNVRENIAESLRKRKTVEAIEGKVKLS
jgi:trigger factor